MYKKTLLLIALLASSCWVQAQKPMLFAQLSDKSASSYPFYRLFEPSFYPAFTVGAEWLYRSRTHFDFFQTLETGAYFHDLLGTGLQVSGSAGVRYKYKVVYTDVMLGAGYLHTFQNHELYEQAADGSYQKAKNVGKPSFMLPLSFSIGLNKTLLHPFVRYRYALQLPYNYFIPFMPSSELSIGIKLHLHETPMSKN